jgi:hypothetical protein
MNDDKIRRIKKHKVNLIMRRRQQHINKTYRKGNNMKKNKNKDEDKEEQETQIQIRTERKITNKKNDTNQKWKNNK